MLHGFQRNFSVEKLCTLNIILSYYVIYYVELDISEFYEYSSTEDVVSACAHTINLGL